MKILLVAKGDWSGAGFALYKAINDTTIHEAHIISFSQSGSYTHYPSDILNPSFDEIRKWVAWADILNIYDNAEDLIPFDCPIKPIIMSYHGSYYRNDPQKANLMATKRNYLQTCLTQDLSIFGPIWIGRAIEDLSAMYSPDPENFIVGHAPTNRKIKGTNYILERLCDLPKIKLDIIEHEANVECLKRKAKVHILIDTISPPGGGAAFGTNALEAWSLGMPVICQASPEIEGRVKELVGYIPYCSPSKDVPLKKLVEKLRDEKDYYNHWRDVGRRYVKEYHAPQVVAERFIDLCAQFIDF